MKQIVQQAIRRNDRPNKPCEDYIACLDGACVVTDGVTQNADEYHEGMTASQASRVAAITAETIARVLSDAPDPTLAAADAVRSAVEKVAAFNASFPSPFPGAAVFVSAAVRGDTLHFAYVGDSVILLIRSGVRIRLSEQQTSHLRVFGSTSGLKITKRTLYDTITNNASHPLGYGVILGDMRALDFLRCASIALQPGDRVILSSDGLDKYLAFAPVGELASLSPDELIERSLPYDEKPYNSYADDKSVVTIDIQA